jgi:hypothetical protein
LSSTTRTRGRWSPAPPTTGAAAAQARASST